MKEFPEFLNWLTTRKGLAALVGALALLPLCTLALIVVAPDRLNYAGSKLLGSVNGVIFITSLLLAAVTTLVAITLWWRSRWTSQSRTVERLKQLQAQYGLAEDLALLGSWVYHVAEDRYDWSNGSFSVFGIDVENGVPSAKGFMICIHPEDQERWRKTHRKAIKTGTDAKIEYRYVKNGREHISVRSVARCEKDASGKVVRLAGIVQDTSAARAMAAQLSRSEAKFRDLSQISSDWFWETDVNHNLSYLSESAEAKLGPWVKNIIGKPRWDSIEPGLKGPDWEQFKQDLMDHKPFNDFVYSRITPEGQLVHISIGGRPLFDEKGYFRGYRGIGRNVTREREQQMLLEIESKMAGIMRELGEPDKVIQQIMKMICRQQGWHGAIYLKRVANTKAIRAADAWGDQAFLSLVKALPKQITLVEGNVEQLAWESGKAVWVSDFSKFPEFAERYQTGAAGLKTAFMAPIIDENNQVMAALLMFGKVSYRSDRFVGQMAEALSRNLSLYLQRKAAEKRLTQASLHDALTGLPNRIYLTHQLEARLKRNEPVAVLYVDLDRFKIINDTLGHQVGDQVLIEVTRRTTEALRPQDVAGRIGGDEFIILLDQLDDPEEIEAIGRRLLAALEKPFLFGGQAYFLSGSVGVAIAPRDGTDSKLLIKCADSAMYQVKSEGRNDVRFFSSELSDDRTEQLQLAAELPSALTRGEVSLHYQPILNIDSRALVGMEALIRWKHPRLGMLLPDRFLPIAEQSNLIREIGFWSVRRAIDDRTNLGLDVFPDAPVSINISAKQLSEEGFLEFIRSTLEEKRFPARLLRLELSESSFIQDPQRTRNLISELRALGLSVIIDNFGTGYASLSYIKSLPVDGIKIDQVFIRDLANDQGNAAIVRAIEALAKTMGMSAMAEGVETAEELRALRDSDCVVVQGTFVSPPLTVERLHGFVETLPVMRELHQLRTSENAA